MSEEDSDFKWAELLSGGTIKLCDDESDYVQLVWKSCCALN